MKDLKISKELIKAVLKKETEILSKDFNFTINEDYIEFSDDGEMQFEYCIYKFAFKCKEWANKNNYYVASGKYYENWDCEIFKISWDAKSWHEPEETFDAPTEPEAIIKACEWILNEVNK